MRVKESKIINRAKLDFWSGLEEKLAYEELEWELMKATEKENQIMKQSEKKELAMMFSAGVTTPSPEPWQMTREEFTINVPITPISKDEAYIKLQNGRFRFDVPPTVEDIVGHAYKRVIKLALAYGWDVPDAVLQDYPDLRDRRNK